MARVIKNERKLSRNIKKKKLGDKWIFRQFTYIDYKDETEKKRNNIGKVTVLNLKIAWVIENVEKQQKIERRKSQENVKNKKTLFINFFAT